MELLGDDRLMSMPPDQETVMDDYPMAKKKSESKPPSTELHWRSDSEIVPRAVGQLDDENLPRPVAQIPWRRNADLLDKVKPKYKQAETRRDFGGWRDNE